MRPLTHHGSGYVARRLGLKCAFLLVIAAVEDALGWDNVVGQLACLSAVLCVVLATYNGERPTAAELNHWDEACWFGLAACLG
jgi:hypothetical protein